MNNTHQAEARIVPTEDNEPDQFTVELGVNLGGFRVCAAEVGVFTSKEEAEAFATSALGRTVESLTDPPAPYNISQMDTSRWDLAVAGWTIERFTDSFGTVESWDSTT